MRASKIHIGLRYCSHSDLIISSGEESCKGADKCNSSVPCCTPNGHTNQILLSNETLNETVRMGILLTDTNTFTCYFSFESYNQFSVCKTSITYSLTYVCRLLFL